MNNEQQKLYDNLLKKVNEYCLGFAAEDVIESIDALVDSYECTGQTPFKALNAIKEQMPKYDEMGTIEVSKSGLRGIENALKALEIIKQYTRLHLTHSTMVITIPPEHDIVFFMDPNDFEILKQVLKGEKNESTN